mmetsp:Transcript_47566/g.97252  ORF Transcript_47566/g.97252 Transcript_47566/m.97252 type:complete len:295 (-) Transcript_47566:1339-2223(-)
MQIHLRRKGIQEFGVCGFKVGHSDKRVHGVLHTNGPAQHSSLSAQLNLIQVHSCFVLLDIRILCGLENDLGELHTLEKSGHVILGDLVVRRNQILGNVNIIPKTKRVRHVGPVPNGTKILGWFKRRWSRRHFLPHHKPRRGPPLVTLCRVLRFYRWNNFEIEGEARRNVVPAIGYESDMHVSSAGDDRKRLLQAGLLHNLHSPHALGAEDASAEGQRVPMLLGGHGSHMRNCYHRGGGAHGRPCPHWLLQYPSSVHTIVVAAIINFAFTDTWFQGVALDGGHVLFHVQEFVLVV